MRITDPETKLLGDIGRELQVEQAKSAKIKWKGSPFAWLKVLSSGSKGATGKKIVSRWLEQKGFVVKPVPGSKSNSFAINNHRVELRISFLWENRNYQFQQIRDRDYKCLLCLGFSPDIAHCWVIPKKEALRHSPPQHGKETRWLSVPTTAIPEWLGKYGGSLREGLAKLSKIRTMK